MPKTTNQLITIHHSTTSRPGKFLARVPCGDLGARVPMLRSQHRRLSPTDLSTGWKNDPSRLTSTDVSKHFKRPLMSGKLLIFGRQLMLPNIWSVNAGKISYWWRHGSTPSMKISQDDQLILQWQGVPLSGDDFQGVASEKPKDQLLTGSTAKPALNL